MGIVAYALGHGGDAVWITRVTNSPVGNRTAMTLVASLALSSAPSKVHIGILDYQPGQSSLCFLGCTTTMFFETSGRCSASDR